MIPAAALDFLRALAANNDKTWFDAHRTTYDDAVRAPAAALVAAVTTELARRDLPLTGDPKRATFRIHRDVRFSKDKRPYKTHIGAVWSRGGGKAPGAGVLYCHLDPAQSFVSAAFYTPDADPLDAIRERIRVRPDHWQQVLAALAEHGLTLERTDALVRMPKGFEDLKDHPTAPDLRLKSFLVRRKLTERQVLGRTLPRLLADHARHALPLLRFGWAAIDEVAQSKLS